MGILLFDIMFTIIITPLVAIILYAHNSGYTPFKKCLLIGFIITVICLILHAILDYYEVKI